MLTKHQAEMITELMRDSRPAGATPWDAPGCMAALATVRDRPLPNIVKAAIRLAENRDARTPMALSKPGPQWREAEAAPRRVEPHDPVSTCDTCGKRRRECESIAESVSGHRFASAAHPPRRLEPDDAAAIATELHDRARPADTTEPDPHGPGSSLSGEEA